MIKDLFKHSIVYGIASVLKNATGFFLLPFYISYLTVSQYGLLEVFIVSITVLTRIIQLGFGSALFKYYSFNEDDSNSVNNSSMISSSFYFIIVFSILVLLIVYIFRVRLSLLLFHQEKYAGLLGMVLLISLFQVVAVIPSAVLRVQNRSGLYSVINFVQFIIQVGLTIFFLGIAKLDINGVLIARIIASIIAGICLVYVIRNYLKTKYSFKIVKEMLSYSIFLVPVSIGSLIIMMSNRYFILLFLNSERLGIFSFGNKIASIVQLGVWAFQMAWPAMMFRIKELDQAKKYYSKIITYYILLFSFGVLSITLFSKEVIELFGNRKYLDSLSIIPILGYSYFFYGLFYAGQVGITIFKKTYFQTISIIIASVVNLGLNYYLTPIYGICGTSVALLISLICLSFLAILFSQRIYYLFIEWRRIIYILFINATILLINYNFLNYSNLKTSVIKFGILFLGIPVLLYNSNFFDITEKKQLNKIFLKILKK